jgi:phage internal scaffolding protein
MSLTMEELKARKKATALNFSIKKDLKGVVLNPEVVSVAVQSKKAECDINRIVQRFKKNGVVDPNIVRKGRFGDFTKAVDFQEMKNRVIRFTDEFMSLPAETRKFFDNDPSKLISFLEDEKNKDKAVELGLWPKPKIETKKIETPQGNFWVTTKDGVEINRVEVKAAAPAPGA